MIKGQAESSGVRLAGPPEFTTTCVLPALADLIRSGLGLKVTLGRPAERLLAGLQDGDYDLVVSTAPPSGDAFIVTDLFREEFLMVAAPAIASKVTGSGFQALQGLPLISYSEDRPVISRYWRELLGKQPGIIPAVVVPDLRGVLSLTVSGAGFTVLPRYLCRKELSCGTLVSVMEPATLPTNTIFLATKAPRAGTVASLCRELLESASSW